MHLAAKLGSRASGSTGCRAPRSTRSRSSDALRPEHSDNSTSVTAPRSSSHTASVSSSFTRGHLSEMGAWIEARDLRQLRVELFLVVGHRRRHHDLHDHVKIAFV